MGEFPDTPMEIRSFEEFWPFYVRAHSGEKTRLLHAIGSVLSIVLVGAAFAESLWLLLAVPVVGYSFAWYAHYFVERNKPATFGHPFYSLLADYRMVFLMMAGRMDAEVRRHVIVPVPRLDDPFATPSP